MKLGFKASAKAARAVIMEPIMKLEVLTPEENMGDIVGDLNRRRGQVNSMDDRAGSKVVKASTLIRNVWLCNFIANLSSGRATSTMEFSHYAETPSNISESVIAEVKDKTLKSFTMSQKIRIKLKSYDYNLVDKSADKIVKTVKTTGAVVTGPIPLPTHKKIFTVLCSPHVNKKSREQFQLCSYKRLLDIYSSSSKTIDALMKLELQMRSGN